MALDGDGVADPVDLGMAGHAHVAVHEHAAEAIALHEQVRQRRIALDASRPHGDADVQRLAALDLHDAGRHARHPGGGADLDARPPQFLARLLGQRGVHAAQDLLAGLQQQQPVVLGTDAAIARHHVGREEVLQLGDQLDAGVAAAHHADREHAAAHGGVGLVVGVLGEIDQVIAQQAAVLERLVLERVVLDAGDVEGRRDAAQRDHQPVVVHHALGQVNAPGVEVDALHPVAAEAEAAGPADVADGLHDVARLDQRGGHLRQQRREQQVVLVADQQQLDVGTVAQALVQHAHGLHAPEAAAQHDDAGHATSSTPGSPATISPSACTRSPAALSAAVTRSTRAGGTTST